MSTLKCALMGFSPSDVESFQTFFKLTATLGISFAHTPRENEAHILIVDASDTAAVDRVRHPAFSAKALVVGDSAPDSRWPVVSRPFRLTKVLQLLQELAADIAPPAQTPAAPPSRPVQGRPHAGLALIIDDSEIAQKATRMKLERWGVEVKIAASGEEALMLLRDHVFAIVFIDVMMEGIDGYQTCKLIKQRKYPGGQSPKAVMLTSRGGTIDKIRGSLAGCDAYLTKPVDDRELMQLLQDANIALPAPAAPPSPPAQGLAHTGLALIIDDSEIAQKATRMKLERLGIEVKIAASGEDALVLLRDHVCAIAFIDVMMEGIDGYQTCKLIKQRKYPGGHSPVAVMLTSRGGTVDKIRGSLAGCDAYLTKPVDDQELMRVLIKHRVIAQSSAHSFP